MIVDWSRCPDVESVPGRCGGAWVVKDSRVIVESCILGNAEAGCTPEEIADMFEVPVDVVKRILAFASPTPDAPDTLFLEPVCTRCEQFKGDGLWSEDENNAVCSEKDCPNKPVTYIRADLYDAEMKRMEENALADIDATGGRIADLTYLLRKARDELDAFGHAELIDEINEALLPS